MAAKCAAAGAGSPIGTASAGKNIHALVQSSDTREGEVDPYIQGSCTVSSADPAPGVGHTPGVRAAVYRAVDPYLGLAVGGIGPQFNAIVVERPIHRCASV